MLKSVSRHYRKATIAVTGRGLKSLVPGLGRELFSIAATLLSSIMKDQLISSLYEHANW